MADRNSGTRKAAGTRRLRPGVMADPRLRLPLACLAFLLTIVSTPPSALPASAFVTRDMAGHEIRLAAPPRRIISLVPSATEIIFALGGEERLVGVTDYCNEPPQAALKPRVGGMVSPSLETIVALRPDLVVVTSEGNSQTTFDQLGRLGIPIYVVAPHRLEEVMGLIARMGELAGRSEAVGPLVQGLRGRVRKIIERVAPLPRPRVLYVLWPEPVIVPGRVDLVTELIELAGGTSITANMAGSYPRLGLEAVIALSPEIIILGRHGGDETPTLRATWERLQSVPALRTGRVHSVDLSLLHRYGPRVVDGLETLARLIHPEAFR
jgi:iron complex transport system substrate-binding protein